MKKIILLIILVLAASFIIFGQNEQSETVVNVEPVQIELTENEAQTDSAYLVDTENSIITWSAEKKIGGGHVGTLNFISGYLNEDVTGEISIDMNSVVSDSPALDEHLKGIDFFNVEEYPNSTLQINELSEGNISADLTVNGVTKKIIVPAEITETDDGLIITSNFQINRTEYGIRYGSENFFDDLGDSIINDTVDIEVELIAKNS